MAVGDVLKLTVNGLSQNGDPNINTFYYLVTAEGTDDDRAALVLAWRGVPLSNYLACLSTFYNVVSYSCYRIWPTKSTLYQYTETSERPGTVASAIPADNIAVTITKRTAIAGKAGRGRLFMPGVPASFISTGEVNTTGLTAYANFCGSVRSAISSGANSFSPVVFNLRTRPPEVSFFNLIIDADTHIILRQQRRRETGVRIHPRKKIVAARSSPSNAEQLTAFARRWAAGNTSIDASDLPKPIPAELLNRQKAEVVSERPSTKQGKSQG